MSVAAMVDNHVAKSQGVRPPTARRRLRPQRGASAEKKQSTTGPSEAVSALVSYVPAEAIAAYVAVVPFVDPSEKGWSGHWWLAVGVVVLTIFYAVGYRYIASVKTGADFKIPILPVVIAVLAFAAWVFAIPDSPFNDFGFYTEGLGGAIGTITATAISFVGVILGEALTYKAAEDEVEGGGGGGGGGEGD